MSDLSLSRDALDRSRSQLPVSSYFDESLFRREQELILPAAPRYLGHELAVPEPGDFHTLAHELDGRALVRRAAGEGGIELLSNVCRHRQAIMLQGRGKLSGGGGGGDGHIVCPLHRWTYDLQGTLVGAPHFQHDPCRNLQRLGSDALQHWHGLLFEPPKRTAANGQRRHVATDLAALGVAAELDFSGYVFHRSHRHECAYNWKTFIEVYLEDYHVGPFHPGLGRFVTCDDLRWELGHHHSVQTVGVNNALEGPGSDTYRRWHDAVLAYRQGVPPPHGAIWLTLYPTVMVEWYPHVLVVSTLHPQGPRRTLNLVEFFYPEEIVAFEPDFIAAQQAAYMETCAEDDEIALRMDAGRQALLARGECDHGPYQSPMEDGMQHFHEWYGREMAQAVAPAAQGLRSPPLLVRAA